MNIVVSYRYNAYGKLISMIDGNGNNIINNLTNIGNINRVRYRSYYYDTDVCMYYLSSRFYNPELGRFLNADGYLTTGQEVNDCNMYAYCANNPVSRLDPSGHIWSEIKQFFSKVWNGIKNVVKSLFGAEYAKTTVTYAKKEVNNYGLYSVESGDREKVIYSKKGDATKPVSVYAHYDCISYNNTTVGIKLNDKISTIDAHLSFNEIGVDCIYKYSEEKQYSAKLMVDFSSLSIGVEKSLLKWDNAEIAIYERISINGGFVAFAVLAILAGQPQLINCPA